MTTEFDDKLMTDAAKLARGIAPERDLWPDIEAAIAKPRRTRTPFFAQAAAVLLLVAGSSFVTYTVMDTDPVIVERPVNTELGVERASYGGQLELSSEYQMARTNLKAQMDKELARLSPEARAGVEQNLAVIREAIAQINAALEREPGNVLLHDLLLKTYREELDVMRKVGDLTQDVMLRSDI
jgi:hypothetical protein